MRYYEDPILGKGRAADISGGTGGSGTTYIGGFAIGISGETISRLRYMPIESVTGNSVTLQAGHAYKAYATSTAITLNTETVPEGQFGLEGHIEIYVAGTGYVMTGTNVVLANALEPDSVNNCTLRFHDGVCIISVEDHVAGYIVVNGATSGSGSLYYGITTSTNDYVAFDASLNGQVIPLAGAVAEGEKHIVGNGYTETAITGAVDCGTSKFTVANLGLQNVQVTGGTMTIGDAYIPSGSTVAVSGGGLAVEKVTGNGGVIDGGGTTLFTLGSCSGCTLSGFSGSQLGTGAIGLNYGTVVSSCIVSGNSASNGGFITIWKGANNFGSCLFADTIISGNTGLYDFYVHGGTPGLANVILSGCSVSDNITLQGNGKISFAGNNHFAGSAHAIFNDVAQGGTVTISSGAILDLTGNTNATPIAPGGGITFAPGGATVYPSAGQASAYMLGGMTVPTIGNTNVVNLNSSNVVISSGATAYASGCTFTGGLATTNGGAIAGNDSSFLSLSSCMVSGCSASTTGGAMYLPNCSADLNDCTIIGNSATVCGGIAVRYPGGKATLSNCTVSGNSARDIIVENGAVEFLGGCTVGINALTGSSGVIVFSGFNQVDVVNTAYGGSGTVTISSGASINLTSSIAPGGTGGITVLTGGCTVNGNTIPAGTYTSIDSNGTPT